MNLKKRGENWCMENIKGIKSLRRRQKEPTENKVGFGIKAQRKEFQINFLPTQAINSYRK